LKLQNLITAATGYLFYMRVYRSWKRIDDVDNPKIYRHSLSHLFLNRTAMVNRISPLSNRTKIFKFASFQSGFLGFAKPQASRFAPFNFTPTLMFSLFMTAVSIRLSQSLQSLFINAKVAFHDHFDPQQSGSMPIRLPFTHWQKINLKLPELCLMYRCYRRISKR
jgi:hypothetical protein